MRPSAVRGGRRLERLEERTGAASTTKSFSCRIHLADPEKGLTGIPVLESDKSTIHVDPTREEVERVRASLEQSRAAARISTDIRS
jgi:hypothetical protein